MVGFIGLGDMGGAMAERIVEAGFDLAVFDLRPQAIDALVARGAKAAASVGDVGASADVVVLCVVDDGQVIDVVRSQLVGSMHPGSVLIVTSSVLPETIRTVHDLLAAGDVAVVDVPVSGSRPAVAAGTLTLMLGGDVEVIERVTPILETFGGRLFHVGGHGAGQAMKIANNIMLHMNHLVALEAVRFARSEGLDEEALIEIVNTGSGRSWVTETWGLIDQMFRDHPQAGTAGIYDMMVKEMWNAVVLGKGTQTALPLTVLGVQVGKSLLVERERVLGIVPAEERE